MTRGGAAGTAAVQAALAAIPLGHAERFRKTVGETDVYTFAAVTGDLSPIQIPFTGIKPKPKKGVAKKAAKKTAAKKSAAKKN